MASEAQRIMNLSLTKIVSSRSRRGGVSLHRNLLVASVLFKARDVYAAEMAGLVVIHNGCVYDRTEVDDRVAQKAETQDLPNENQSTDETHTTDDNPSTDENLIRDEQVMETVDAVVCPFVPDSTRERSEKVDLSGNKSSENNSDCELESSKENIEPADSIQNTADNVSNIVKRKRCRKVLNKQCMKRKYTEVEQAVLSITENDDSGVSKKMSRVENVNCGEKASLNRSELSTNLPEWSSDRLCVNREDNQFSTAGMPQDYKSCMDMSENAYSSCVSDGDQPTYSELSSYQSSFHSFNSDYCTSPSTDAITFSLSHPMLVVSV